MHFLVVSFGIRFFILWIRDLSNDYCCLRFVGSDSGASRCKAFVTFKDPKALEIALLLSVSHYSRCLSFQLFIHISCE